MLFLDLEFYVPKEERIQRGSSMIVNPSNPGHLLLGGAFFSKKLDERVPGSPRIQGLWIWDHNGDETALLKRIKKRFEEEWQATRSEGAWVLKKPIEDLVVCGAGISRFDLPALYCRSVLREVDHAAPLFDLFLKTKQIDLSNVGSFLFPDDPALYPKTTREMAGRLQIEERKGSSKGVWEAYDTGDRASIAERTERELRTVLGIYAKLQERIASVTKSP